MNFIVWLMAGAGIGWLANRVMRANAQQTVLLNLVVGIVGALSAGLLLTPLLGLSTPNGGSFSLPALLVSLVGGVNLLTVVTLIRHSRPQLR